MRVCITTTDSVDGIGGLEWSLHRIADMLIEAGWEVDLVQLDLDTLTDDWSFDIPGVSEGEGWRPGVRIWRARGIYTGAPRFRQAAAVLERLYRVRQYSLFHAFFLSSAGFITTVVGRRLGIPVIVSARGSDINRDIFSPDHLDRIVWTLTNAAVLTFVSKQLAETADMIHPCRERSVVIYNSTSDQYFSVPNPPLPRRPQSYLLGGAGTLTYKKNWVELLEVCARLRKAQVPAQIVWLGSVGAMDQAAIYARVHALGLQELVHTTGDILHSHMLHNLQQLDVFVSVAIDEGCPNALLEAMLAARPIVAYATGAIPELIRDGQEGLVLKPATTEHLVRSLHSLWERPDWAADLGRAARQRVLEMYNPAKEQGEWLNCYAIALTGQ